MGALTRCDLPATEDADGVRARALAAMGEADNSVFRIHHTLHAGLYTRTAFVRAGSTILGAAIKIPTTLIVTGRCVVNVGSLPVTLTGTNVLTAAAHRRQFFGAVEDTAITMAFSTRAQTVEDAEREFTDEWESLVSGPLDTQHITGVPLCQES